MDGTPNTILPDVYRRLGAPSAAPVVLEVRAGDTFSAEDRVIVSAFPWDVGREPPQPTRPNWPKACTQLWKRRRLPKD